MKKNFEKRKIRKKKEKKNEKTKKFSLFQKILKTFLKIGQT